MKMHQFILKRLARRTAAFLIFGALAIPSLTHAQITFTFTDNGDGTTTVMGDGTATVTNDVGESPDNIQFAVGYYNTFGFRGNSKCSSDFSESCD